MDKDYESMSEEEKSVLTAEVQHHVKVLRNEDESFTQDERRVSARRVLDLNQPRIKSAQRGAAEANVGNEAKYDTLWEDYNTLGSGLTMPLVAVAPLIDDVRFLIREWDALPTMTAEDRQRRLEQLVTTYNAAAAGVGRKPSDVKIIQSEDAQKGILIGLGCEIVRERNEADKATTLAT